MVRWATALLSMAACSSQGKPTAAAAQLAKQMQSGRMVQANRAYEMPYRLFVPKGYSSSSSYPLVLYLHGAGSWGTDNFKQLTGDVQQLVTRAQRVEPSFVLAPHCPAGDQWARGGHSAPFLNYKQRDVPESDAAKLTTAILDKIQREYSIDSDRVYVTGPSMGGTGTWDFITRYEGKFAAAIPVTGINDPSRAKVIAKMPIWAFHGSEDQVSPVANTREMVKVLKALGSQVKFSEFAGTGHDSWTRAYATQGLFKWLFAHRRPAASK